MVRFCASALISLLLQLGPSGPLFGETPPNARVVIDSLHATLLSTMKEADQLGYTGRYNTFDPVIRRTFDLPTIARIAVGRYWKEFDEGQKTDLVGTFSDLSVATYASRFDGYSGEIFRFVSEKPLKKNRMLIRTQLIKKDGETVSLDYILHQVNGPWQIVNVIAEGVSDISLKRGQYTAIIKKHGFESLLTKLKEKIEGYSKETF